MESSTLYLAIYGSIISTSALLWNIIRYIKGRKGKLKITPSLNTKFPVSNVGIVTEPFTSLDVFVVNLSEKTRYIKQPQFELDQKNNKYIGIINLNNPVSYPVELKTGEEFSLGYNIDSINDDKLDKIIAKKFRVRILDTHGKEYMSKWYNTKDFHLKR